MQKKGKFRLVILTVLVAAINYLCGCSVVGLGVGAVIDGWTPDYKQVGIERVNSIKPRTKTVVHLDNGSLKTGKFKQLVTKKVPEKPHNDFGTNAVSIEETLILQINSTRDSLIRSGASGEKTCEYINLSDVTSVEVKRTKYCKWIGLAVGLAIDFYNMGKAFSNMTFDLSPKGSDH